MKDKEIKEIENIESNRFQSVNKRMFRIFAGELNNGRIDLDKYIPHASEMELPVSISVEGNKYYSFT